MSRAKVRRPAGDDRPLNRPAATRTALALLAVLDQKSRRIVGIARFEFDRLAQNTANRAQQPLHVFIAHSIDLTARIDRSAIKSFVRIEISDSGDDVLREE